MYYCNRIIAVLTNCCDHVSIKIILVEIFKIKNIFTIFVEMISTYVRTVVHSRLNTVSSLRFENPPFILHIRALVSCVSVCVGM